MKKIQLKEICGVEVLSRANVRKLYDHIDADTEVIDMTGISFISRSVADELCIITDANPGCTLSGGSEDVEMMLEIVRKGRNSKRDYSSKAKVSMTFNCRTMDDLRKALLTFGM